ncbi:MAG: glycosyltransferase family 4 protein [Candidatus Omnitrophota bacterium]
MISYEFPPVGGGTGKALLYTAREFVRMGHEVGVLTLRFNGQAREDKIDGIQVFRIPAVRKKIYGSNAWEIITFSFSGFFYAGKVAKKFKPDLTMAYFTIPSGLVSLWLKWILRIPFVTLLRGQDVPGWLPEILKFYHVICKPIIRLVWRESEKVIANSRGLAEIAKRSAPKMDIPVIPNGIDPELYCPLPGRKKEDKVSIIFTGRLRPQKGLNYLIESIGQIKRETQRGSFPDFCLKIAGAGAKEGFLKDLVKQKGLEKEVRFLGRLDEDELIKAYQESDIFVNPSLNEGMPNAVLEAMACGLPCMVTDVEGNNELVREGENGLLVPPKDPLALAAAFRKLIENGSLREQMGRRGREIIEEGFSWQRTAEKLMDIIKI